MFHVKQDYFLHILEASVLSQLIRCRLLESVYTAVRERDLCITFEINYIPWTFQPTFIDNKQSNGYKHDWTNSLICSFVTSENSHRSQFIHITDKLMHYDCWIDNTIKRRLLVTVWAIRGKRKERLAKTKGKRTTKMKERKKMDKIFRWENLIWGSGIYASVSP